jgi:hypothetical protein
MNSISRIAKITNMMIQERVVQTLFRMVHELEKNTNEVEVGIDFVMSNAMHMFSI